MPESSSSLELLTTILNIFPSLLSGSEVLFIKLYGELYIAKETLLHILARAAPQMSVSLSDIYPFLERVCLEGAASEAKYAVSTIASLTDSQGSSMLSKLFQKLVSNLRHDQNLATVLQCLLCMLKHSLLAVASLNDLADEVFCKFFSPKKTASSEDFNTNPLCNLKGFALKLLVKIFLTTKTTEVKLQQVKDLMVILHNTLKSQEAVNNVTTSRGNLDQLSLTAAKSVLRLSSRWDLHIVPQLFHLTVLMARYPSPAIQKEFLNKTHDLLGKRALPIRFSCTYALIPLQSSAELQGEAHKYMAEFIQEYSHRTLVCKDPSLRNLDREKLIHCSEYIVVYLIHVLAHVQSFPSQISEQDMNVDFIGPLLLLLRALLVPYTESSDKDVGGTVSFLLGIFRAIRKAEDAVDADITPKLHVLADIGLLMTKELSHDLKMSPDGPGMILLPSAFYKISNNIRSRENSAYEHLISEPCIKKMVRLQEDDKVFDFKSEKIQNLASDRKVELTSTGKENSDECQTKLLVAQTVELCNEISENKSTIQEPVPEVHRCSDPESSCGSAITRPFSNSQVAAGQVDLATGHEHIIHRVAPTRRAIEKTKGNSYKKDLNASDEALVGSRISLWSPLNKCFCSGMVDSYDSENKSHKVTYDNGNIEQLHLNCERWEIISSTCSTDKETPHFNGSMVSSDARLKLFDDIFEDNSSQEDPIVGRKSSAKKKPEVSVSATGSLRRSKRLKKT